MNTEVNGLRLSNRIESHFIPFERRLKKAKRLTFYRNMEQAKKDLSLFKEQIDTFKEKIAEGEQTLRSQKRYLMTLCIKKTESRHRIEDEIIVLEKKIHASKKQLEQSEARYNELNQKFLNLQ